MPDSCTGSGSQPEVRLAPVEAAELSQIAGWLSDSEVNQWLTSEWRGRDVESREVAILARSPKNYIRRMEISGQSVGMVALSSIDRVDQYAEIWYFLGDRSWAGQGAATAAVALICQEARELLGLNSIYARIMESNVSSRRVLEKNDFELAGRLRKSMHFQGRPVDCLMYDRLL